LSCIEKLSHTCGSSDGLQVFAAEGGGVNGYCFSCNTYVPHPYGDNPPPSTYTPKTQEEIDEEISEIKELKAQALPSRALKEEYLAYFEVGVGVSTSDGHTPSYTNYPYTRQGRIVGFKTKPLDYKASWFVGTGKDIDMFGWPQALKAAGKSLYITEGEEDAVALFQAFKERAKGTKYADANPAVVSLTKGAANAVNDIRRHLADINTWSRVVLVFDDDEQGRRATKEVMQIVRKAEAATLPDCKDANEAVMKGRSKKLAESVLFNTERPKNSRLVTGASVRAAARAVPEMGLSFPWDKLTQLTRGARFGETYYWGAGVVISPIKTV